MPINDLISDLESMTDTPRGYLDHASGAGFTGNRRLAAAALHYFGYSAKLIGQAMGYSVWHVYTMIDAGLHDPRYPGVIARLRGKYLIQERRIYALKNGARREVHQITKN